MVIIGDITIGNNVTIGAGSVVLDSIPDNALVVGEKARVKGAMLAIEVRRGVCL